jgi:diaminopimelate epimerase
MGLDIIKNEKIFLGSCCMNKFIVVDSTGYDLPIKFKSDFAIKYIPKYDVDSVLFFYKKDNKNYLEIFEKDGSESDSCGNGLLLVTHIFNLVNNSIIMKGGPVNTIISKDKISIIMDIHYASVSGIPDRDDGIFVKMGEPHAVFILKNIEKENIVKFYNDVQKKYQKTINIDLIENVKDYNYKIRTYERGVFSETKSCGTGSMSSFLALSYLNDENYKNVVEFNSAGGTHYVSKNDTYLKLETSTNFCEFKNIKLY